MRLTSLTIAVVLIGAASPARAEIALLRNGMTFKVASRRTEGASVYLELKGGGEIGFPESELRGFVPDEVMDEVEPGAAAGGDLRALAIEAAQRHGLDPALVLAVVGVESAFRSDAVSPKGAQGLMQLMPATAASLGVSDPLDPAANLDGGTRHLGSLLERYHGNLVKALAAYNAGAGAVDRHGGVPPFAETRTYVGKVLDRYRPVH
jgi:soluble lytic murein transglycosylase-like protein